MRDACPLPARSVSRAHRTARPSPLEREWVIRAFLRRQVRRRPERGNLKPVARKDTMAHLQCVLGTVPHRIGHHSRITIVPGHSTRRLGTRRIDLAVKSILLTGPTIQVEVNRGDESVLVSQRRKGNSTLGNQPQKGAAPCRRLRRSRACSLVPRASRVVRHFGGENRERGSFGVSCPRNGGSSSVALDTVSQQGIGLAVPPS
jgi:hypothetical protein